MISSWLPLWKFKGLPEQEERLHQHTIPTTIDRIAWGHSSIWEREHHLYLDTQIREVVQSHAR